MLVGTIIALTVAGICFAYDQIWSWRALAKKKTKLSPTTEDTIAAAKVVAKATKQLLSR